MAMRIAPLWFVLACGGNAVPTTTDVDANPIDPAGGEIQPLHIAFTFHLEGTSLVADKTAFDRYVTNIRSTAQVFHRNGAIATWEAAEIVAKSKTFGVNILKELEDGGDAIALHANGVGYSPNDPNYTVQKMQTDLIALRAGIDELGVHVRDVSNICSSVDWVAAVRAAGFEAVTGVVDYCLKSLPDPGATAAACASPDKCHTPYPHDTVSRSSSWYAASGADWTTPADSGLLILPTMGALPCAAEEAAGAVSPTMCPYGTDDIPAAMAELDAAVAARQPGQVHSYVLVASFGQTPNAQIIEALFQQIKTKYIDTGIARWVGVPELIDRRTAK